MNIRISNDVQTETYPEKTTNNGEPADHHPNQTTDLIRASNPHLPESIEMANWSSSLRSLLDQPPAAMPSRLIMGGLLFLLAFLTWAWFGKIEQIGTAQGKLVPKGETYKVESIDVGKVSRILVKEGEAVTSGQIIAELDTTLARGEVDRLEQVLEAYQNELNQQTNLLAQVMSEAQQHQTIAMAETLGQIAAINSAQSKAAASRQLLMQHKQNLSAYQTRQERLNLLSGLTQEQLKELKSELAAHQNRIKKLKPLAEKGAISNEFVFQAEQARRQARQELTESKLQTITNVGEQIFQTDQSLQDLDSRIIQSQGTLASDLKTVEQLKAELDLKKEERERIRLGAVEKVEKLKLEIAQIETKITENKNQIRNAKLQLEQQFLKAPVNGIVLSFNLKNTGKVVQSGDTIAEIAPYNSPLILSATIPNKDAGFIDINMPVKIKLDAYSYQDYGIVPGKVISISEDAVTDEKLGAVYQVDIELEREHIMENHQVINFRPGQTAIADIIIRKKRILDILFDPFRKLQ